MVVFEMIIIGVGVAGSALCATAAFGTKPTLNELGRQGSMWFDHADDHQVAELPADDGAEEQITFRPLRARMR